jgi:hypothetical protein
MDIHLEWQSIITAAAVVGAVVALISYFGKLVRWVDRQKQQDEKIDALKATHEHDVADIKKEQTLLIYGMLACLKGLKEQGCNGPVTEAIDKIEKHINRKAHE